MEFKNENGAAVKNGTAKEANNHAAQNSALKKPPVQAEKPTNGAIKTEAPKANPESAKPKTVKAEVSAITTDAATQQKPEQPKVPAMSLEAKLKVVNDLHRKSVQRVNLITRMKQLEAFEVALAQENDELEDNPYQGCKLIIRDDKNREFITTTPGLIRIVSQFIFNACREKLVVIEGTIAFPG
jgi:hypothetical protein